MQASTPKNSSRIPSLILRTLDKHRLAIRFQQIGSHQRFQVILMRFRADFPFAICQELEGYRAWWILPVQQHEEVIAFCKRNGLMMMEES
jgi:hypothetical protein